jgi:hypothetical protein
MADDKIVETSINFTSASLTSYALDKFIAPKLSTLSVCGAIELPEQPNFGAALRVNSMLFLGAAAPATILMQTFVNRVEFAGAEYNAARNSLIEYVSLLGERRLTPYFQAVAHFENCIFHLYLAVLCNRQLLALVGEPSFFKPGDKSAYDRLRILFNRVKHFDEDIDTLEPTSTDMLLRPLWLTNDGLECKQGVLSFAEFLELIIAAFDDAKYFAVELPQQIQQRRKAETEAEASNR